MTDVKTEDRDVVERLWATFDAWMDPSDMTHLPTEAALLAETADEITRLRSQLKEAREAVAAENEACAMIAAQHEFPWTARAIRARISKQEGR